MHVYGFLITTFLVITIAGHSQKKSKEYGFHAGVNFNKGYGNENVNNTGRWITGINAGGHIKFNVSEKLGFITIFQFEQAGWSEKYVYDNNAGNGFDNVDYTVKANYLSVPMLLESTFGKKVKVRLNGGVFIAGLLYNVVVIKKEPITFPGPTTTDRTSDYQRLINFGLAGGVGTQIPITVKMSITLDGSTHLGLIPVDRSTGPSNNFPKTFSLLISPGVKFKI